jgi:hypothetical protein
LQNCLDKAIDEFPARDQGDQFNNAELTTLSKTLSAIISWTSLHDESNWQGSTKLSIVPRFAVARVLRPA